MSEKEAVRDQGLESPALGQSSAVEGHIRPQQRPPHDSSVTFEEYHYYALRAREEESHMEAPSTNWIGMMFGKTTTHEVTTDAQVHSDTEKRLTQGQKLQITDEEWTNASRAFRTAGWGAVWYLINTDILGPYSVGFAFGTLGWGPGIALFTVFGFFAGYSGYLIWHVYMGVDSYQFPVKNYGDLGQRTWGTTLRQITNFMQALGLLLLLGQVTIQYGQNISSMSKFKLCYAVCPILFVIVGFFLTQIRTLKAYGVIASLCVWSTLLTIFITMGVIANSPPNYAISVLGSAGSAVDKTTITPNAAGEYPKVFHYAKMPANSLVGSINGLLAGVLAYAGAQLFVEFMAEMKRPRDFLKAMWSAQIFIYVVYVIYGSFVYYYQGQYSFGPSYQGVSSYAWQTVGNAISLFGALIAAGLYGNIGIKVFYNNVLVDIFRVPPLVTKYGKLLYALIVPVWWAIAYVIAAAIPDYFGFVSVMSASCLLNLTYTLPPVLALGFDINKYAPREGEGFDPATGPFPRTVSTTQRLWRGFVGGGPLQTAKNVWHVIYFLASLSMCGLGMYAAIQGLIDAFQADQLNSFSCKSPLNLNA